MGALAAVVLTGCGLHEVNNDRGGAINLAVAQAFVLVARGEAGLDVVRGEDGSVVHHIDPAGDSDSIDDVASEGDVVIVHDADDGYVSSYHLGDDGTLSAATVDLELDSGPYSGVSLQGGVVIVSGGTCGITRLALGGDGTLTITGNLEAFRGLPDVTALPWGALLSTHFSGDEDEFVDGQEFGITTLEVASLTTVASAGLAGAGFTPGGGRPASWPVRVAFNSPLALIAHGGGFDSFTIGENLSLVRERHLDPPFVPIDAIFTTLAGGGFVVGIDPPTVAVVDMDLDGSIHLGRTFALPAEAQPTALAFLQGRVFVADPDLGLLVVDP